MVVVAAFVVVFGGRFDRHGCCLSLSFLYQISFSTTRLFWNTGRRTARQSNDFTPTGLQDRVCLELKAVVLMVIYYREVRAQETKLAARSGVDLETPCPSIEVARTIWDRQDEASGKSTTEYAGQTTSNEKGGTGGLPAASLCLLDIGLDARGECMPVLTNKMIHERHRSVL